MNKFTSKFIAVIITASLATVVQAATIATYSVGEGQVSQEVNIAYPGTIQDLQFRKFDTSLGTLTSVQIMYNISYYGGDATVAFYNTMPPVGTELTGVLDYSVSASLTAGANAPAAVATTTTLFSEKSNVKLVYGTNDSYTWHGPEKANAKTSNLGTTITGGSVGDFNGAADETFLVGYNTQYSAASSSFSGAMYETTTHTGVTSGSMTVVYNYTPVPEPATGALAFAGIGLLAMIRRRRRA